MTLLLVTLRRVLGTRAGGGGGGGAKGFSERKYKLKQRASENFAILMLKHFA